MDLDGPERDGAYVIFGSVVHAYLEELVAKNDIAEASRVMDFIEFLANETDRRWPELVQIEFGEWVYGYPQKATLENLAGPETRKAIWNAERYFLQTERNNNGSPFITFLRRLILPRKKKN